MKKFTTLVFVSVLGGILTLGSYKLFVEEADYPGSLEPRTESIGNRFLPVSNDSAIYGTNVDFTAAAEKTVHAVVHVKMLQFLTNQKVFGSNITGVETQEKPFRAQVRGDYYSGWLYCNQQSCDKRCQ